MTNPTTDEARLLALANEIERDGITFAKRTRCADPWYNTAARDMAAAADCLSVAAALRALAQS